MAVGSSGCLIFTQETLPGSFTRALHITRFALFAHTHSHCRRLKLLSSTLGPRHDLRRRVQGGAVVRMKHDLHVVRIHIVARKATLHHHRLLLLRGAARPGRPELDLAFWVRIGMLGRVAALHTRARHNVLDAGAFIDVPFAVIVARK